MDLFERFLYLQVQFGPRHRGHNSQPLHMRLAAQTEMFHLAQAIASQYVPDLQRNLTEARAKVVASLFNRANTHELTKLVVSVPTRPMALHWEQIELTPELAHSLDLTGRTVPKKLVVEFKHLHRQQIQSVKELVRIYQRQGDNR